MNPERFAALLDEATAAAPPAPPTVEALAAGHARLRRRRLAAGAGAAALVVAATALGLGLRGGSEPRGVEPVAPPSGPSPAQACRAELPRSFFPSATQVAADSSDRSTVLEFVSSDGDHWAACEVSELGDGALELSAYDVTGDHLYPFDQAPAPGCAESLGCPTWALTVYDRLDPAVDTVVFRLWDGTRVSVPTHDGFYAFAYSDDLPAGVAWSDGSALTGSGYQEPQVLEVTYLDADGEPLAAARLDGRGTGRHRAGVAGVPLAWDAYPSLKGQL